MKKLPQLCLAAIAIFLGLLTWNVTIGTSVKAYGDPSLHVNQGSEVVPENELRASSQKAIAVIQRSQGIWYQRQECASCHHQFLPEIPINLARRRGVTIDEKAAQSETGAAFSFLKDLDVAAQGTEFIDVANNGWSLFAAHIAGVKPSITTGIYARLIASRQASDGSWTTFDSRPPQSFSHFTLTAICAQSLRSYMPAQFSDETQSRIAKARDWLIRTPVQTTEDRAFQLFGMHWTGADSRVRKEAAVRLLSEQHEDGGWSELPNLPSDAYSTGQVLAALSEAAALPTSDRAYQSGLRFLIKTQQPDGSWRVNSRIHHPAPVSPRYFESGFPYQHDQFISIMGTTWAATALLEAVPAKGGSDSVPAAALNAGPAEEPAWARVAEAGSVAELKSLLDSGLSPNSKTGGGTTVLMLAALDLEKVALLIERGADVNAHAASGITPLMAAAQYPHNAPVVKLLLDKGAMADPGPGTEVRNDSSAMFFAVMAGDIETVRLLAKSGAKLKPMRLLGQIPISPLNYAVTGCEPAMLECLIQLGANPNEQSPPGISMLEWAAIGDRVDAARVLLAHGAEVNHVDDLKMTPLLYSASMDYGNSEIFEMLLSAGADLGAKNREGLTALDLAKKYHHQSIENVLARRQGAR